jgi:hypothetical protein
VNAVDEPRRDELLLRIDTRVQTILTDLSDHERRIRSTERFRWLVTGAGVVSGSVLGGFLSNSAQALTR